MFFTAFFADFIGVLSNENLKIIRIIRRIGKKRVRICAETDSLYIIYGADLFK